MRKGMLSVVLAVATIGTGTAARAQGQLTASEPASISQVVDGTKVTIEYSRPRARGRTGLFGTEVTWGHIWTPGANQATTLAVSRDVSINGHAVAKGKYTVWMVVVPGDWELVLDHDTTLFHTQGPHRRAGQIRFIVPREHRAFTETLTWSFPTVRTSGMLLTMQWDTVYVPLDIKVMPTFTTAVPPDAAQRVAGTYHWRWSPEFANPGVGDTTLSHEPPMKYPASMLTVRYVGNELHATFDPPLYDSPRYGEYLLIRRRGDLYSFGRVYGGELVEIWDFCALQFTVANGQPASFEVRGTDDDLWASGKAEH